MEDGALFVAALAYNIEGPKVLLEAAGVLGCEGMTDSHAQGGAKGGLSEREGGVSRRPALSAYQRLTHKPRASYGYALGQPDWRLVSGFDCVGTPE